jgi:hypothetical protein
MRNTSFTHIDGFGCGLILLDFFFVVCKAGDGVAVGVNAGGLIDRHFFCDCGVVCGDGD